MWVVLASAAALTGMWFVLRVPALAECDDEASLQVYRRTRLLALAAMATVLLLPLVAGATAMDAGIASLVVGGHLLGVAELRRRLRGRGFFSVASHRVVTVLGVGHVLLTVAASTWWFTSPSDMAADDLYLSALLGAWAYELYLLPHVCVLCALSAVASRMLWRRRQAQTQGLPPSS